MSHKASPRRTGKIRKQIVHWPFQMVFKHPKKGLKTVKQWVAVHSPVPW